MSNRNSSIGIEPLEDRRLLSALSPGGVVNASQLSGAQLEEKIAVNPRNPNNVVAVSLDSSTHRIDVMTSTDGGNSFNVSYIGAGQDRHAQNADRLDAKVAFDRWGNCYVAYIVGVDSSQSDLIVARSSNGGRSFVATTAVASGGVQVDNPSIAVGRDARTAKWEGIWVSYGDNSNNQIHAVEAVSKKRGRLTRFTSPYDVSAHGGGSSSIAVGPDGEVVVAWQSPDDGSGPQSIYTASDPNGFRGQFGTDALAAITQIGGSDSLPAQPNRGIDANPGIAFDNSQSNFRGRLYLVYTQTDTPGDTNTSIQIQSSDNLGASWNSASEVDDGVAASRFFPSLAVDPVSGKVGVTWYDTRRSSNDTRVDVYASASSPGGANFGSDTRITSRQSTSAGDAGGLSGFDFGDYAGVAFYNNVLRPVWADNSNSTGDNPNGTGRGYNIYTSAVLVD